MLRQLLKDLQVVQLHVVFLEPVLQVQLALLWGVGGFPQQLHPLIRAAVQPTGAVSHIHDLPENGVVLDADPIVVGGSLEQVLVGRQADQGVEIVGHYQLLHDGFGYQRAVDGVILPVPFAPGTDEADGEELNGAAPRLDHRRQLFDVLEHDVLGRVVQGVVDQ